MVAYRDALGFVHYRTHAEEEYVPRKFLGRRPKYPEQTEAFKRLYPALDVDRAVVVANWVDPRQG